MNIILYIFVHWSTRTVLVLQCTKMMMIMMMIIMMMMMMMVLMFWTSWCILLQSKGTEFVIKISVSKFLPSSFVLATSMELFGPSPTEVKANTWNSYSVYVASPMTSLIRFPPPFIINFNDGPREPFFLYNSLNPVMFPCLAFSGGNCQDAVILVDVLATTVKPLGACEGTEIKKNKIKFISRRIYVKTPDGNK